MVCANAPGDSDCPWLLPWGQTSGAQIYKWCSYTMHIIYIYIYISIWYYTKIMYATCYCIVYVYTIVRPINAIHVCILYICIVYIYIYYIYIYIYIYHVPNDYTISCWRGLLRPDKLRCIQRICNIRIAPPHWCPQTPIK